MVSPEHADIRVGVLALQGDFADHIDLMNSCGFRTVAVRMGLDLEGCDALVIPGGESTTMLKLIDRVDLREPLIKRIKSGMPAFGTCAGTIVLANRVTDGEVPLGLLPVEIQRNAYGRQTESFEADIDVPILGSTLCGVFIRAPVIRSVEDGVEVLATWEGHPVLVQSGRVLAATFHPELAGEPGLHRYFVEQVCDRPFVPGPSDEVAEGVGA